MILHFRCWRIWTSKLKKSEKKWRIFVSLFLVILFKTLLLLLFLLLLLKLPIYNSLAMETILSALIIIVNLPALNLNSLLMPRSRMVRERKRFMKILYPASSHTQVIPLSKALNLLSIEIRTLRKTWRFHYLHQ